MEHFRRKKLSPPKSPAKFHLIFHWSKELSLLFVFCFFLFCNRETRVGVSTLGSYSLQQGALWKPAEDIFRARFILMCDLAKKNFFSLGNRKPFDQEECSAYITSSKKFNETLELSWWVCTVLRWFLLVSDQTLGAGFGLWSLVSQKRKWVREKAEEARGTGIGSKFPLFFFGSGWEGGNNHFRSLYSVIVWGQ